MAYAGAGLGLFIGALMCICHETGDLGWFELITAGLCGGLGAKAL